MYKSSCALLCKSVCLLKGIMFGQVSKRGKYDMQELRSIVQKMHRNPDLLKGGWKEFFYFLDEYFPTMLNDPSKLLLFLVEDCARCPLGILKAVTDIFQTARKDVAIDDYRKVSAAIARQPVDRSAAYLSVACLDLVSPLSEEEKLSLIHERAERWEWVLGSEEERETLDSFIACMALISREVRAAPREYPMPLDSALRIAAALSHLVAWDMKYCKVRLDKRCVRNTLAWLFVRKIHPSVRVVRPLICGLVAANDWMRRAHATMEPKAKLHVDQYIEMGLACCGNNSARLDLLAMNAILVLTGRFPDESASDFMSESLPCDPNDVPSHPRAFPMPEVSQDRHTRRGKLIDTTNILKKRCERLEEKVPDNFNYSHGPPAHTKKQGFEEFMEHIQACEDHTSDGREPVFKEKALCAYRALPEGVEKKRMQILKRKLDISAGEPRKRLASKRKRKEDARHLAQKRTMNQMQKDS